MALNYLPMPRDPAFLFYPEDWNTPNTYDSNFKSPPERSGVYLLVHPNIDLKNKTLEYQIMYVGSAKDLAQRYDRHEVRRFLNEVYGYIQFYFKETDNYKLVEIDLIKSIRPKFNKQHNG